MDTREQLRDELIAVFGATRELSPDADRHLAEVFLSRMEQQIQPRVGARKLQSGRRPGGLTFVRYALALLFLVLLLGPAFAFTMKGMTEHISATGIPWLYVCMLLIIAGCVAITMYLERHSVHVRVTRRHHGPSASGGGA